MLWRIHIYTLLKHTKTCGLYDRIPKKTSTSLKRNVFEGNRTSAAKGAKVQTRGVQVHSNPTFFFTFFFPTSTSRSRSVSPALTHPLDERQMRDFDRLIKLVGYETAPELTTSGQLLSVPGPSQQAAGLISEQLPLTQHSESAYTALPPSLAAPFLADQYGNDVLQATHTQTDWWSLRGAKLPARMPPFLGVSTPNQTDATPFTVLRYTVEYWYRAVQDQAR